jgi:hypothetical protein
METYNYFISNTFYWTPSLIWELSFSHHIERTVPFSRLKDTQEDAEDLFKLDPREWV